MPPLDTFAKRKRKREIAGSIDVYQYDQIPDFLRRQLWLAITAGVGEWSDTGYSGNANGYYERICGVLEREIESFPRRGERAIDRCRMFMFNELDASNWLSMIELFCRVLSKASGERFSMKERGAHQDPSDALAEINIRFRENSFGYEFSDGDIIRIDDQFVHSEVIKPALALLREQHFKLAQDDFMTAHRHYRAGEYKDAIVAANRAFESTMKAICKIKGWKYESGARASDLIKVLRGNGLFPDFLEDGFNTYISMLKTGLPAIRNNAGGHGDSPAAPEVPDYLPSYAIHLTAANIVLLVSAMRQKA